MSSRLSNKYITNLELSAPIVDNRPETQSILSSIAKSRRPKPAIYDGWVLAGSLEQTDEMCGKWFRLGCLNSHDDNLLKYQTVLKKRNGFVKPFKRMCGKLGCRVCFMPTGAKRSFEIKKRFDLHDKYYGSNYPIHVIVSPLANTSLDYTTMRKLVNKRLKNVGMKSWILIPHHFRTCRETKIKTVQNKELENGFLKSLQNSQQVLQNRHDLEDKNIKAKPGEFIIIKSGASQEHVSISNPSVSNRGFDKLGIHFHAVGYGFIDGKKQAKLFRDSEEKIIVRNTKNKNRNIRKTISYLLSHCSTHETNKFHSITYNGYLSYTNRCLSKTRWSYGLDGKLYKDGFEESEENNLMNCPICGEKLRMIEYVGIDRPPDIKDSYLDNSNNWQYVKKKYNFASIYYGN